MFKSSYQTTTGANFFKPDLIDHLRQAKAERQLHQVLPGIARLYALTESNAQTKTIPQFDHPVCMAEAREADYWVIDLRQYAAKLSANRGELPDEGPLNLMVKRTLLEIYWNTESPLALQKASDIPLLVYSQWVTGVLRGRLHADPVAEEQIRIIAAYYHLHQYIDKEQLTAAAAEGYALRIGRLMHVDPTKITKYLADVPYMANISEFCNTLRKKVALQSIELVDPGFLFTLLGGSWFGSVDARQLVNCSLEYPPIFISMILSSQERGYKRTILGDTVAKQQRSLVDKLRVSVEELLRPLRTRT